VLELLENLIHIEIAVPVYQMIFFVLVVTLCLLFTRFKLGSSVTFCFTFYWGFIYNKEIFIEIEGFSPFFFFYLFSGLFIIVCTLASFFVEE